MKEKTLIRDFTQGSIFPMLLAFSLPLMGCNLLQTVYNLVDMVVIGQFVGSVGLSAVTIGGDVLHLMTFIVMGVAGAGQVLLSRFIGAGERHKVNNAVGTMFSFTLASAVVIAAAALIFLDKILALMNTPAEAIADARAYCVTCILGLIFIYGYNLVSAILRGMGDSRHPLLFISVATVVNLVLDLLFVAVFHMGAFGAALATVIGQAVSFLWSFFFLYRRREAFCFDFKPRSFIPDPTFLPQLVKLGLPMALQFGAVHFSMMFVNSFLNGYGVIASAVSGIGTKLGGITSVVTHALATAGSSMVGQNLGAKRYERIPQIVRAIMIMNLIFAALLAVVTACFPRAVFGLFNNEPAVLDMAMTYIPIALLTYLGFALRSPFSALINGSGMAKLNLALGLLDGIIARIGLALLLGIVANWGILGFWYGNALAGFVPFFFGLIFLFSRRWMNSPTPKAE